MENVRDHNNPTSGCYSDTTWSSKDGRFWSSMACKGLPPIAHFGIEELPVRYTVGENRLKRSHFQLQINQKMIPRYAR